MFTKTITVTYITDTCLPKSVLLILLSYMDNTINEIQANINIC